MTTVKFHHQTFGLVPGESVLDCLLRNGQPVQHSCKSGLCQSCLVQAVDCTPPPRSQQGLKPALQASGHALACQWQPEEDVAVALPDSRTLSAEGRIKDMQLLNPVVMKLLVTATDPVSMKDCRPGQYVNLLNDAGIMRSYSVANDYQRQGHLEFHIAATAAGEFSNWLFKQAKAGDALQICGPAGACLYVPEGDQQYPLLLAGVGTGLAPLYGIVNDALAQGHRGPVTLIHGSTRAANLYYRRELATLTQQYPNFTYLPVVLQAADDEQCQQGDAGQLTLQALARHAAAETRVYLCGDPAFVQNLRKQVFLKGVRSANINCDPFVERAVQPAAAGVPA